MSAQPNQIIAIRQAIITNFTNEMNNAGGNPNGRLTMIKAVGGSWVDGIAQWPYIGVVPIRERVSLTAKLQKDLIVTWGINTVVRSSISTEDAYNQLLTVLDDGGGNGVNAVLDSYSHFTLGGLVYASLRQQTDYFDDLAKDRSSGTNQFAAYAMTQFETRTRLNVV